MNAKKKKHISGWQNKLWNHQAKKIIYYKDEEKPHEKTLFLGEWNVFILVAKIKVK